MVPNGEAPDWVKNNPLLKGIKLPRTGRADRVGLLVTKTLLFAGEGAGLYGSMGGGGNKFRAHDKSTGEILAEIAELSDGVPRRINRLADLALLVGYADGRHKLTATDVAAVSDELATVGVE